MLYVFVPYYSDDTPEFQESLKKQKVKFRLIRRNRKWDGIYWTKALRDFQREVKRFCGITDEDIVCVMNNDIQFDENLFAEGCKVKRGEVYLPEGVSIDWKRKEFYCGGWVKKICGKIDSFYGRCFFMTVNDFVNVKFSKLLPQYLSDIDFGCRVIRKGIKPVQMCSTIYHPPHPYENGKVFSIISERNPIFWTVFLLKHFNRYTILNIIKSWIWWRN